jgi:hypothetical protein
MNPRTPRLLALALGALVSAALALLATDALAPAGSEHAEALQRLVGGLGGGPAVDLSRCAFSFDPRVCPDCPLNLDPIPGGKCFCPQHACSILYCRSLVSEASRPAAEPRNGRLP